LSDIWDPNRNSEARHRQILEAARREHQRVFEEATRIYEENLLKEEQKRLLEEKRKEEDRIRLEKEIAADRAKLHALKATKVEIPPPPTPEPEQHKAPAANTKRAEASQSASQLDGVSPQSSQANGVKTNPFASTLNANKLQQPTVSSPAAPTSSPLAQSKTQALNGFAAAPKSPFGLLNGTLSGNQVRSNGASSPAQPVQPAVKAPAPAPAPAPAAPDRYTIIHQNLKALRKSMAEQAQTNEALKNRMGDMRREVRKSVGQLTGGGGGANRQQITKITALLREAGMNQVQSQLVDASNFVLEPRQPVPGASNNNPQLPSLFIYLLNIFAKAAISQFINEAGARPETADPVGVVVASTFAEPDFMWCGEPMIDILLAKFRIVCPVLFGYKGSEQTEQGRARLGWWKDSGAWVSEQMHMDRMTGLGAGFAAVALRSFAKSKKDNPYPPRHYWAAMARIVNTPPAQISNTQCVVLKSMIQNYEHKFIEFYGTAAIAALRLALVEFPARAPNKSPAINSLEVMAQLLKRDSGLVLG